MTVILAKQSTIGAAIRCETDVLAPESPVRTFRVLLGIGEMGLLEPAAEGLGHAFFIARIAAPSWNSFAKP